MRSNTVKQTERDPFSPSGTCAEVVRRPSGTRRLAAGSAEITHVVTRLRLSCSQLTEDAVWASPSVLPQILPKSDF